MGMMGLFFFFQAEDGIRDHCVTGVQTCALLISSRRRHTISLCDWSSDVCSSDLAAQGASAGDARLQRALGFLKAGNVKEAEPLFRAVAEEKAARIKTDSKDAATAFRNLGAIAGFADPKRALDAYQKAAELDPDDMESIFFVVC